VSDDIPVQPRSRDDIERVAEGLRRELDPEDQWAPHILFLLAGAGHLEGARDLQVIFLPDQEMGDDEARAESKPPRICIRKSLEADARANAPRARSTLAHELGHVVLHPGVPKFRKSAGNAKMVNLSASKSAETQAWIFARAFLMPSWKVEQVGSALELSLRCRVSNEIAKIRYEQFERATKRRPEVLGVRDVIDKIRSAEPASTIDPRIRAERERVRAWERARHVDGENPARSRRSDDRGSGYRIEWRHYGQALSPTGWFVKDGQALSYYGKDR